MSSATEPTEFYLELLPPLFLYPDFLPLAKGGMHRGLKNKTTHTHTHTHTPLWPVALNFKDSELTATSRSP